MKHIVAGLVLGALGGIAVPLGACAAQQHPDRATAKREAILALWTQIRDWRREAHME